MKKKIKEYTLYRLMKKCEKLAEDKGYHFCFSVYASYPDKKIVWDATVPYVTSTKSRGCLGNAILRLLIDMEEL